MIILKHKIYQNYLLTLFLVSGALKVFLDYYDYPFNLTTQLLVLILLDIGYCFLVSKTIKLGNSDLFYLLLLLLFYVLAGLSLFYTKSDNFAYKKFIYMIIPLTGFIYVKFIKELDLRVLYKVLIYIIIPLAIWFILFKYLLWDNTGVMSFLVDKTKFGPLRHEYLNFGFLIGLFALLSIQFSKKPAFAILASVVLILGLATRGALIFLSLTFFIIYFQKITSFFVLLRVKKRTLKNLALVIFPLILLGLVFIEKISNALYFGLARFSSLINIGQDSSALERLNQYIYVIEEGLTFQGLTIGYGLGSFGINYVGVDESAYPHNVFLEAWYEMGFFSMCILILFFLSPFKLNKSNLLKSLALFALLNAMKSHSFAYDRNLFVLFGILIFHGYNYGVKTNKMKKR
ncbi:O-antigen ligase family protein [Spongiimicrobium sp. 3-5]|uniref:O-antigen ligase family protein n=1 Tax=Spongiimicrobium sp. 3-5 TaxID=3332596 RepID=UPI00397FB863